MFSIVTQESYRYPNISPRRAIDTRKSNLHEWYCYGLLPQKASNMAQYYGYFTYARYTYAKKAFILILNHKYMINIYLPKCYCYYIDTIAIQLK